MFKSRSFCDGIVVTLAIHNYTPKIILAIYRIVSVEAKDVLVRFWSIECCCASKCRNEPKTQLWTRTLLHKLLWMRQEQYQLCFCAVEFLTYLPKLLICQALSSIFGAHGSNIWVCPVGLMIGYRIITNSSQCGIVLAISCRFFFFLTCQYPLTSGAD